MDPFGRLLGNNFTFTPNYFSNRIRHGFGNLIIYGEVVRHPTTLFSSNGDKSPGHDGYTTYSSKNHGPLCSRMCVSQGTAWVQCTGALDSLRCCHVYKNCTKLDMWQHLNGSSAPVHWTQAFPYQPYIPSFLLMYVVNATILTLVPKVPNFLK
jgi:hypothetical protein